MTGEAGKGASSRDPLLATVRLLLGVAMAFMLGTAAVAALAAPALLLWRDAVVARLAGQGAPPETIWAIVALGAMAAGLALLGFYFFRHLYRIVGSVGDGDPFVPVNAERLSAMAWISIAAHVIAVPMATLGRWVESVTEQLHMELDIPLAGLFLALVLFVLARVFREGTRLRQEVEGTV